MKWSITIALLALWLMYQVAAWALSTQRTVAAEVRSAHRLSEQLEASMAFSVLSLEWKTALAWSSPARSEILGASIARWQAIASEASASSLYADQACRFRAYLALLLAESAHDGTRLSEAERQQLLLPDECHEFQLTLRAAFPELYGAANSLICDAAVGQFGATWANSLIELRIAESCEDLSRAKVARESMIQRGGTTLDGLGAVIAFKTLVTVMGVLILAIWLVRRKALPRFRSAAELRSADPRVGLGSFVRAHTARLIAILVLTVAVLVPWNSAILKLQSSSIVWLELIPELVGLFVIIGLTHRWDNHRWQCWTAPREFLRLETVGWALILFALLNIGKELLLELMGQRPVLVLSEVVESGVAVVAVASLVYVIAGPLFEELSFRGLLFSSLRRCLALPTAAGFSAVIFAAVHVGFPWQETVLVGWLGIVTALGYEWSGSVWPLVLCHALWNLPAFIIQPVW